MKRIYAILTALLLTLSLAACSQSETTSKEGDKKEEPKLTAQEVFEKSLQASQDLKSFSLKMEMNQVMSADSEESLEINSIAEMEMITEPLALYQKMTMNVPGQGEQTTETYFTNEGMFIYDPSGGVWIKYPADMEELSGTANAQASNPAAQMEMLKDFADEISMAEEGKYYVLKLKASSGEKFDDLIKKTLEQTMQEGAFGNGELEQLINEMMSALKLNNMTYEIFVDRDTYYPVKMNHAQIQARTRKNRLPAGFFFLNLCRG